jgi:hypothetical protein
VDGGNSKSAELSMRRLVISIILVFSLMGAAAVSSPTTPQNQNSGKSASNKNSGKSKANKNTGATTSTKGGNPDAKVWVNTDSGVYHCAGSKWYGKTKSGQYMTQKEAEDKNYHADHGKSCQ